MKMDFNKPPQILRGLFFFEKAYPKNQSRRFPIHQLTSLPIHRLSLSVWVLTCVGNISKERQNSRTARSIRNDNFKLQNFRRFVGFHVQNT